MVIKIVKKIYRVVFATSDTRVSCYIKLLCICKDKNLSGLGIVLSRRLQRKYGVFISYTTVFDNTLILRHPTSIVIGEGVRLGKNVKIFQNVTLGRSDMNVDGYPTVDDNVIIYSGAAILGNIRIGKNSIVGANAVVIKDVPEDHIAVGVPARNIKRDSKSIYSPL